MFQLSDYIFNCDINCHNIKKLLCDFGAVFTDGMYIGI